MISKRFIINSTPETASWPSCEKLGPHREVNSKLLGSKWRPLDTKIQVKNNIFPELKNDFKTIHHKFNTWNRELTELRKARTSPGGQQLAKFSLANIVACSWPSTWLVKAGFRADLADKFDEESLPFGICRDGEFQKKITTYMRWVRNLEFQCLGDDLFVRFSEQKCDALCFIPWDRRNE